MMLQLVRKQSKKHCQITHQQLMRELPSVGIYIHIFITILAWQKVCTNKKTLSRVTVFARPCVPNAWVGNTGGHLCGISSPPTVQVKVKECIYERGLWDEDKQRLPKSHSFSFCEIVDEEKEEDGGNPDCNDIAEEGGYNGESSDVGGSDEAVVDSGEEGPDDDADEDAATDTDHEGKSGSQLALHTEYDHRTEVEYQSGDGHEKSRRRLSHRAPPSAFARLCMRHGPMDIK